MSEVNERHERAALIALLTGDNAEDFVAEALTEQTGAAQSIAAAVARVIEQGTALSKQALADELLSEVTDYIRSCPAFESAVERAEQDDREAAADAKYDADRDDRLTGDRT